LKLIKEKFSTFIASQQYTLEVIRPDAYADGKANEIVDKVNTINFLYILS